MISVIRSGLAGVSQEIAVISNNIANANSIGFKKSMASFNDVYTEQVGLRPGAGSGLGISLTDPRR
ncbi:MAG: flagellar basal body protein, partial [Pseudomonadota bacterium]|nr:flagellar basal body protein [Pseudomonadota bacterium]